MLIFFLNIGWLPAHPPYKLLSFDKQLHEFLWSSYYTYCLLPKRYELKSTRELLVMNNANRYSIFCEKFQNRYPADCNPNLRICLCRQIAGSLCPKSIKKATSLEIIYSLMMMSQGSHANHRLWLMKIHTTSDQNMPGKSQRNNHASFCVVFILL